MAISRLIKKVKDFFSSEENIPTQLSPERIEKIIEAILSYVSYYNMKMPALLFFSPLKGMSTFISQTIVLQLVPYLEIWGIPGFELTAFLDNKENVVKLLKKIEELPG